MIGVIAQAAERGVVEEFFQLFKTPWEFYREGRSYDVVVVTADEVPDVDAKLVLVYGAELKRRDPVATTLTALSEGRTVLIDYQGSRVPVYGAVRVFEKGEGGIPCITADAGIVGVKVPSSDCTMLRLGYSLFREVEYLLSVGQPPENAHTPTLDMHIMMLRDWILDAGLLSWKFLRLPRVIGSQSVSRTTSISSGYAITSSITRCGDFFTGPPSARSVISSGAGSRGGAL